VDTRRTLGPAQPFPRCRRSLSERDFRTIVYTTHGTGSGRARAGSTRSDLDEEAHKRGSAGRDGTYCQVERSPTNQKAAGSSPAERTTKCPILQDFYLAVLG
jgi:hypothetical protein